MIETLDSNALVNPATNDKSGSPRFGATFIWGKNTMQEQPNPDQVRFYFQNCRIPATDADRVTIYKDMLSLNADVIGLAETCLNSRTQTTRLQVDDDFRRLWPSQKTTFSSANEQKQGRYQRGGTLQILTGKLSSRVVTQGSDDMGRFCWQRLHRSNTHRLTIITAYRVCQTTPQAAGLTSAYYQQWRALSQQGIKFPNPRQSFLADIGALIASHQADGNEIILQLDANTTSNTSEWWDFLETHNLVDLHGIVSSDPFPNSFASGTTKIDYI